MSLSAAGAFEGAVFGAADGELFAVDFEKVKCSDCGLRCGDVGDFNVCEAFFTAGPAVARKDNALVVYAELFEQREKIFFSGVARITRNEQTNHLAGSARVLSRKAPHRESMIAVRASSIN